MDKNGKKKILYLSLVLLLALIILFAFIDTGSRGERITTQEAYTMLENGEIEEWYAVENSVIQIKKVGSKLGENEFPLNSDFYVEYTDDFYQLFLEKTIALNEGDEQAGIEPMNIKYNAVPQGPSAWDTIMPIMYIILGVVLIYFLFKMFSSNGKGAMSFGKSRAKASVNVKVRFSDIAGADEEKEELQEVVEFLKNPAKFTSLGARIPKGVLLVGPPGTGKTLLARAVAGESNVPFLNISGSDFVEMFVGVGASRVRDLFDQAKRSAPCIVFIDEIDAVGRQRGAGLGGGNDEREQTLNQLLVEMDGFEANEGIIVLAATNRADVLDPALLRPGRFDRQIYVNVPDVRGREGIIRIHAKNKHLDDDIDFKTLARITSGFTGADIENMLNEAAILAARAGRPKIIMEDLTEGINKVIMGPQKKSRLVTEADKQITAYHEAGHAILGKKLKYCEGVQEVSIIPRGSAAGYTMSRPENDDQHMSYNKLNDRIAEFMGGRIAEELIFHDITTGASNDIQVATNIARKMVTEWGMSKKFGFVNFGNDQEVFIGRDYQSKNSYSEKTAGEIDQEVQDILKYNYTRAKKVLEENMQYLHELSKLLIEKETIYSNELDMLLAGKTTEQIVRHMNNEVKKRKKKEEEVKAEYDLIKKVKENEIKVKTAEVFLKNGIISKEDYDKIVALHNESVKELEAHKEKKLKKSVPEYNEVQVVEAEKTQPEENKEDKKESKDADLVKEEKTKEPSVEEKPKKRTYKKKEKQDKEDKGE